MRPFATFDIADAAEGTGYHLNELPIWNEADDSFEEQGFHDQMGECDYESFEAAQNLGSMSYAMLGILITSTLLIPKLACFKLCGCFKDKIN
jgi:hypothetical protein